MATSDDGWWQRLTAALGSGPYLTGAVLGFACAVLALPFLLGSRWLLLTAVLVFLARPVYASLQALRNKSSNQVDTDPADGSHDGATQRRTPLARTFFFLDRPRTEGLLNQFEGGAVKEITERRSELIRAGLVAGIHAGGVRADGSLGSEAAREAARSMRPTPETTFNLLHAYLRRKQLLRTLDLHAAAFDGRPPALEQYCETMVDCEVVFDSRPRRSANISTPRMDVTLNLTENGATDDTEDAQGRVTVMGRISGSHNLPGNRTDLTIRVFAIYR